MILFIYNLVIKIFIFIATIKLLKDKDQLKQRLFLKKSQKKINCIWFHFSSVGEFLTALPVIEYVHKNTNYKLLLTTQTATAYKLIEEKIKFDIYKEYLIFDSPKIINRFFNYYDVKLIFWLESDFFPNILKYIKQHKIKTILLNGRLSNQSFKKWKLTKKLFKEMLSSFSLIIAGSWSSKNNFEYFISNKKIEVISLKYRLSHSNFVESKKLELEEKFKNNTKYLALSTHDGEEEELLKIHQNLSKIYEGLVTIIMPRHIERLERIISAIKKYNISYKKHSSNSNSVLDSGIYLVDSFGLVSLFCEAVDIIFVGKSLTKLAKGGHNILEPMSLKKAVIVGNFTDNFKEIVEEAIEKEALIKVKDTKELEEKVKLLLENDSLREKIAKNAESFVKLKANNLEKIIEIINPFLKNA